MRLVSTALVLSLMCACGGDDDPTQQVVNIRDEPAGSNCAQGGTVIEVGMDENSDGVLDSGEVTSSTYVCDPEVTSNTLVALAPEDPGENCALGGTALLTGEDTNGNGVLDPDEVVTTDYVCHGASVDPVIDGNVVINSTLDAALFASFAEVTGDLTFAAGIDKADLSFPALTTVGGDLVVDNDVATSLDLSGLDSVGDSLIISGSQLETVNIPLLTALPGGSLIVVDVDSLVTLTLAITEVGQAVVVSGANDMISLDLSALETVGTDLLLQDLPALTSADLSALSAIRDLSLDGVGDGADPAAIDLSSLQTVSGSLNIAASDLEYIDFSALTSVAGNLTLSSSGVGTLTVPVLETVGDSLSIVQVSTLITLAAPALLSTNDLYIIENPALDTLTLTVLDEITSEYFVLDNPSLACADADAVFNGLTTQPTDYQVDNNQDGCSGVAN